MKRIEFKPFKILNQVNSKYLKYLNHKYLFHYSHNELRKWNQIYISLSKSSLNNIFFRSFHSLHSFHLLNDLNLNIHKKLKAREINESNEMNEIDTIIKEMISYMKENTLLSASKALQVFREIYPNKSQTELKKLIQIARNKLMNTGEPISKEEMQKIKSFIEFFILKQSESYKKAQTNIEKLNNINHQINESSNTSMNSISNILPVGTIVMNCVMELRKIYPHIERRKIYNLVSSIYSRILKKSLHPDQLNQIKNIVKLNIKKNPTEICDIINTKELKFVQRSALYTIVTKEIDRIKRKELSKENKYLIQNTIRKHLNHYIKNESIILNTQDFQLFDLSQICDIVENEISSLKLSRTQIYEYVRIEIRNLMLNSVDKQMKSKIKIFINHALLEKKNSLHLFDLSNSKFFNELSDEVSSNFNISKWISNHLIKGELQKLQRYETKHQLSIILKQYQLNPEQSTLKLTEELIQKVNLPRRRIYEIVKGLKSKQSKVDISNQDKKQIQEYILSIHNEIIQDKFSISSICDYLNVKFPNVPRLALDEIVRLEILKIQRKQLTLEDRNILKKIIQEIPIQKLFNDEPNYSIIDEIHSKVSYPRNMVKYMLDQHRKTLVRKQNKNE